MFKMTNVVKSRSGLPVNIWISPKMGKLGAHIKVQKDYSDKISNNLFSVTINDEPMVIGDTGDLEAKDITKIIQFVKCNKELLLQFWNLEKDDPVEVILALKRYNDIDPCRLKPSIVRGNEEG